MKELTQSDLKLALDNCATLTGDQEFVVVGSVSILGAKPLAAGTLTVSADIDLFPRFNESGDKNQLIEQHFGPGSQFELENSFYIEGVGSWTMMTAPKEWQKRLVPIRTGSGVTGWCLDPYDLAYNKLEAGRDKDIKYIAELIEKSYVSLPRLEKFILENTPNQEIRAQLEENLRLATKQQ